MRRQAGTGRALLFGAIVGSALAAAPVAAQQLSGVAVGPDGVPLADTPVVLHRVGGGAGAFVATDTTDGDGRFAFVLEPADSAVHFAAIRYDGRLYIGPALRSGAGPVTDYEVRVDPANEAGAVASALSGRPGGAAMDGGRSAGGAQRPGSSTRSGTGGGSEAGAFLLVGLLALAAGIAFFIAAPRYRQRRTREALLELASIENALESGAGDDRAALEADRDRLRSQLAPGS